MADGEFVEVVRGRGGPRRRWAGGGTAGTAGEAGEAGGAGGAGGAGAPRRAPQEPDPKALEALEAAWKEKMRISVENDEHPLFRAFRLWVTSDQREGETAPQPGRRGRLEEFEGSHVVVSVEQFFSAWRGRFPGPEDFGDLRIEAKLMVFVAEALRPDWDDQTNTRGGRWTAVLRADARGRLPPEAHDLWKDLCLSLVGGGLPRRDSAAGAVLVRKGPYLRYALWMKDAEDEETVLAVGRALRALFPADLELLFQRHRSDDPRAYVHRLA